MKRLAFFSDLVDRLSGVWTGFTDRERKLVSLLGIALVLTVVALGITSFRTSLESKREAIAQKELIIQEVAKLSATYRQAEAVRNQIESRLRGAPVRLFSYLEETAKKQNMDIGDMQDRGNDTRDGVVRSTVEVSFASIELKPLLRFINEIEKSPRVVKVEKLRIRHRNDDPDRLDVSLTVSTYNLANS